MLEKTTFVTIKEGDYNPHTNSVLFATVRHYDDNGKLCRECQYEGITTSTLERLDKLVPTTSILYECDPSSGFSLEYIIRRNGDAFRRRVS